MIKTDDKADLTVALCVYNCEKYILETLECINNQNFKNFNIIFYNDASTDNTVDIIENYCESKNIQYKLINGSVNHGLAYGRSYIEDMVDTKYLLFIDGDDCPYENLVEKLYNKITSDHDLIAVGCHHEFIDSNGDSMPGGLFIGCSTKEQFWDKARRKKLIFMQPTAIINVAYLRGVGGRSIKGFPEGKPRYQDLCEDLDLWTRMSDLYVDGKAIVVIPEKLCRYRKHEASLSANSLGMFLRMKHIKQNLKLRRNGNSELSFNDFLSSLTKTDMQSIKAKSQSADSLRNSVYYFKKYNVYGFIKEVIKCVYYDPSYLWQKIKSNSGILK